MKLSGICVQPPVFAFVMILFLVVLLYVRVRLPRRGQSQGNILVKTWAAPRFAAGISITPNTA